MFEDVWAFGKFLLELAKGLHFNGSCLAFYRVRDVNVFVFLNNGIKSCGGGISTSQQAILRPGNFFLRIRARNLWLWV